MRFVIPYAIVTATLSILLSVSAPHAEPFRIIVTEPETPLVPNSLMYLAKSEGYFDRAGVDVELIATAQTPMAVAALQSGAGEMANISIDALISLQRENVRDVVAVHSAGKTIPYVIAARKDLTLGTLAGSRFGIGRIRSLDHDLSANVLESYGVNVDTLQMVPLGEPKVRAQALAAGRIDATTLSVGSFLAMPDHEKFGILVDTDAFFAKVPMVTKANAVRLSVLENRGDDVEKVLEAMTLAARDFAADPDRWQQAMTRARPDVPAATLATLSEIYAGSWTVNGGLQWDELLYTARHTQHGVTRREGGEDTPFRVEVEDWSDFRPMDRVLAKIGISDAGDKVSRPR